MSLLANEIKADLLDVRLAAPPFDDAEVGLFKNVVAPTADAVLADITPITGTGYTSLALTGWTAGVLTSDGRAISIADEVIWDNSSGSPWDEATGWYYFSPGAGKLIRSGMFNVPITVGAGETYPFTPSYTLDG